jgi:hypothetical protein
MVVTERRKRLLALCAIRVNKESVDWSLIARQAQFDEGLVGFQNSAGGPDLGFYAARSYSLMRSPRTSRHVIRCTPRSATGWSGRGGRSSRPRCGLSDLASSRPRGRVRRAVAGALEGCWAKG